MHGASSEGSRDLLRAPGPTVAAGILVGLLATEWSGLWGRSPAGSLALVTALGVAPGLVHAAAPRRSGLWVTLTAAAAAIVMLGASAGSDPFAVVTGDRATWSRLADILPEGLGNASATPLPLAADRAEALSALLVLVLGGAAALVAWQVIVSRRPLAAVIAAATGLAYRWTLVPPDHVVLTGAATLVLALVAFRVARPRRAASPSTPARAVLLGTAVTVVALLGSIGVDRAGGWWDWRSWTFGAGSRLSSLDLGQGYGPLVYADEPVLLVRVETEQPIPLRAVSLESFDGTSFVQTSNVARSNVARGDRILLAPDTSGGPQATTQKITLAGARTPWLLAGGRPLEVRGLGRRRVIELDDGSVRLQPSLGRNAEYEVDTLFPDPTAASLIAVRNLGQVDGRLLTISPGGGADPIAVPAWGSGARPPDPAAFGRYEGVYLLSRRIVGTARSPYEAVNKIEAWVRRDGGYGYDEAVTRPVDVPDLVDFLLVRKRGYCQHFAGAMALMLRMNGIPARVAVGLTSGAGRFDPDTATYEIVDRDAHSWVEVLFPGYGWLPFDPTPSRSVPNRASVSSPSYSRAGIDIDVDPGISAAPVLPTSPLPAGLREPRLPDGPAGGPAGGTSLLWLLVVAGVLVAAVLTPPAWKVGRRIRRRRGDERARVLGAARELESLALDAGWPIDPAMTPTERADALRRDLGIDAERVYGLARAARFAPTDPPSGSAKAAWDALARARRALGWRRRLRAGLRIRSLRG